MYIGAPLDSTYLAQSGSVDRQVNQSRVYGITTSTIANPTLTAGGTLRINNVQVSVPDAPYNNINGLINAINSSLIPNAVALPTNDLTFVGDGTTKIFNIGTLYSAATSYTTVVYVNDELSVAGVDYSYDSTTQQIYFVYAPIPNAIIKVISGRMTISVQNADAAIANNMLTVLPGTVNSVFDELGLLSNNGTDVDGNVLTSLLTHVIFHPVQKSLNRQIQIDYTVRIQALTNLVTI